MYRGYKYWTFSKREYELSKLALNSSFCAVTADSKSRWLHGKNNFSFFAVCKPFRIRRFEKFNFRSDTEPVLENQTGNRAIWLVDILYQPSQELSRVIVFLTKPLHFASGKLCKSEWTEHVASLLAGHKPDPTPPMLKVLEKWFALEIITHSRTCGATVPQVYNSMPSPHPPHPHDSCPHPTPSSQCGANPF